MEAAAVWSSDSAAALHSGPPVDTPPVGTRGGDVASPASPEVGDQEVFRSFSEHQLSVSSCQFDDSMMKCEFKTLSRSLFEGIGRNSDFKLQNANK